MARKLHIVYLFKLNRGEFKMSVDIKHLPCTNTRAVSLVSRSGSYLYVALNPLTLQNYKLKMKRAIVEIENVNI